MNLRQTRRLWFVLLLLIISSLVVTLVLFALKQNISLFFAPLEVTQGKAPFNTRIRIGGMVEKNSFKRGQDLEVQFRVTDFHHTIAVYYQGSLPDLFREGQGVVASGKLLNENYFVADEILAKHDENYMPPEVSDTLKQKSMKQNNVNQESIRPNILIQKIENSIEDKKS